MQKQKYIILYSKMNKIDSVKQNQSTNKGKIPCSTRPPFLLFCIYIIQVFCSAGVSCDLKETLGARQLFSYRGFQNAQLFHVQVPQMADRLRFTFAANVTEGCSFTNITLFFRFNGLPIVNLNDYSLPVNTSVYQPFDRELMFLSDKLEHDVVFDDPEPGEIFVAGFLLDSSERIQQQGLVRSCKTFTWGSVDISLPEAEGSREIDENPVNSTELVRHSFPESLVVKWNVPKTKDSILTLESGQVRHYTWKLLSPYDLGGTLKIHIQLQNSSATIRGRSVYFCAEQPRMENSTCGILNGTNPSSLTYIPFPISGSWKITLKILQTGNVTRFTGDKGVSLSMEVSLGPCFDSSCGLHGKCLQYFINGILYSTCVCTDGYEGLGCTDDSEASGDSLLLASVLLLTLSNLFFVPSIVLAFRRKFYPQCLMYCCTMLFSTFYHACDQDAFSFCVLPYRVLQFGDFFGALTSVWLTAIAASQLQVRAALRETIDVAGIVVVATSVHADPTSFVAFFIPISAGLLLIIGSWIFRSYRERLCFPGRRYLLRSVVPCAVFALSGLVCFAFLETETNYFYVHSIWHICIALAIVFILPNNALVAHFQNGQDPKP